MNNPEKLVHDFLKTFKDYDYLIELIDIYIKVYRYQETYKTIYDIDPEEEKVACIKGIMEILDDSINNEFSDTYRDRW